MLPQDARTASESLYASWRHQREAGQAPPFEEFCAAHPTRAKELRALHAGFDRVGALLAIDPSGAKSSASPEQPATGPFDELVARLTRHRPDESRYQERDEIARGGMGQVLEVYDVDLRRAVAKKVMLPAGTKPGQPDPSDPSILGRFFEEAQVTAQLAHPGVVPVHELGIDENGRVYFTMQRVAGRTLEKVFQLAREEQETWNLPRAVSVMTRVCETMAYAHSRHVIHRDLKPSNVMVGSFGEVYVMDWGLAKVLGGGRGKSAAQPGETPAVTVSTDRRDASNRDVLAGLLTETGQASGTPGYMAPEQASGQVNRLDARTDVYALGAMLYSLLTGQRPFADVLKSRKVAPYVEAVKAGRYRPIEELAPDAPPELVSISKRAMATDPKDRYPDAQAMGDDLRRWSEGRVVVAHESGAWAEARKWVRRNRALAVSLGVAMLAVVGGTTAAAFLQAEGRKAVEKERKVALVNSAPSLVEGLLARAEDEATWPALPEQVPALERWLQDAKALADTRPLLQDARAALRGEPSSFTPEELVGGFRTADTDALDGTARKEEASRLIDSVLDTIDRAALPEDWVQERLALARTVDEITILGASAVERWTKACSAIVVSERYGILDLSPQRGLLPLHEDPDTHLWEFWHVLSGAEPVLDPQTSRWRIGPETGIVLVLIPGGEYILGPQYAKDSEFVDPYSDADSSDPLNHRVRLDPYFIAKFELTQGQWRRASNLSPSYWSVRGGAAPVDSVSWDGCELTARRLDLELPTEAQWEVAARGGSTTRFHTGHYPWSMKGYVNLARESDSEDYEGRSWDYGSPDVLGTQSVGSFLPNGFGIHDIHGNVWEWCRDVFDKSAAPRNGDGLRQAPPAGPDQNYRVMRGGSYDCPWTNVRITFRYDWLKWNSEPDSGVRLARAVR